MRRCLRSGFAALALALVLSGSAQAGPLREQASPSRASLLETIQEWLRFLTPQPVGLAALWDEEGSIMDPDG